MHHTAVGAGVRAHHAASPRVAGGCNNSHRGAAAAHLSPQNAAPNSARRGRSTPAHRMYTSGALVGALGICSTHTISSSVSPSTVGPMHGVQMGEGDAHPFACAPARIRLVIVIGELGAALRLFRAEDHSKDSQSFDDQHPYPCLDDLVHVQYVYDDSMYMYRYSMPYPYSS
jgi:hypothetical protein